MLGSRCLDPPEIFDNHKIIHIVSVMSSPDIVSLCLSLWTREWMSWRGPPSPGPLNAPRLPKKKWWRSMMALVLVLLVLTCERNLLTRLLGGWVPSPGLFRRPSWNLSVIFRWGWVHWPNKYFKTESSFSSVIRPCVSVLQREPPAKVGWQNLQGGREIDPPKKTISGGTTDGDEEEIWRSLRWKSFHLTRLRISNESEAETLCDCQFLLWMAQRVGSLKIRSDIFDKPAKF